MFLFGTKDGIELMRLTLVEVSGNSSQKTQAQNGMLSSDANEAFMLQ